jgi:nucleotide-binding universal stress UspA family protein
VSTDAAPAGLLYLVVGYDGSPPAVRALDAAVRLLHGRDGRIDVVYVAHLPTVDTLSADAMAEMQLIFGEIERDLRAQAAEQLRGREDRWQFERRSGSIADELIAAASEVRDGSPDDTAAVVVGSSSQAMHHLIGSVSVSLARHARMPIVIVP